MFPNFWGLQKETEMHRKAPVSSVPQHQPLLSGGWGEQLWHPVFLRVQSHCGAWRLQRTRAQTSPHLRVTGQREDNRSCHQPSPGQPEHVCRDQALPYQQWYPVVVERGGLLRKEWNSAGEEEEREDACEENRASVIPALPWRPRHPASAETQQQAQGWFK